MGFVVYSVAMTVALPDGRVQNIVMLGKDLAEKTEDTGRNTCIAKVIGSPVASFPTVNIGLLHAEYWNKPQIELWNKIGRTL